MGQPLQDPVLIRLRERIRAEVDPDFEFSSPGEIPWCPPPAEITKVPVALVTTAGLHLKGDKPFDTENRFGDTSFRVIPTGTPPSALDLKAPYVDQRHIPLDPEVALPLRALANLHKEGACGPPAARHASFSGGIVRPFPGLKESAASLAAVFQGDGVGAVILLPSCPLCVQTVCLLARDLEARRIPTVCITLVPELTRIVGAPRSLALRFPFGAPCGDPGNRSLHGAVLREALESLGDRGEPATIRASGLTWRRR